MGERIRWRREALGISQEALATTVGLAQQTIAGMEADPKRRSRFVVQIAAALNLNAQWLATGVGPPIPGEPEDESSGGVLVERTSGEEDYLPVELLSAALDHERAGQRSLAVVRARAYLGAVSEQKRPPRARRRTT